MKYVTYVSALLLFTSCAQEKMPAPELIEKATKAESIECVSDDGKYPFTAFKACDRVTCGAAFRFTSTEANQLPEQSETYIPYLKLDQLIYVKRSRNTGVWSIFWGMLDSDFTRPVKLRLENEDREQQRVFSVGGQPGPLSFSMTFTCQI